ncbi:MBL fold metallo-hydrolase [Lewinella sp. W8]|uniref:MBL fold metallo-hydrolase n=1 Tax=Lewinella sp. W8 TaxID=2528208 RepID=UPI001068350F|nr:MBL fold metallo-hydrolase [Lewinella sp. W8]MTB51021.1 MBL fold metallo-hydrolase [Lewinella sp. W8]
MITSLQTVMAGSLELDGGAMFGVVPKSVWERKYPPQPDSNRCRWAMRCLLIRTDDGRNILVDTGIGDKDDAKFREHFQPSLPLELALHLPAGPNFPTESPGETAATNPILWAEEITDVFFTHLHFDHVGGASYLDERGQTQLRFPNATHWVCDAQWRWARDPNPREAASFLPRNLDPLQDSGRLKFLPAERDDFTWLPGIQLRTVYGHTEAMQLLLLDLPDGQRLAYGADLIPSSAHMSVPWVMAYDVRPLRTLAEKERLLTEAVDGDWTLLFEHDFHLAGGKLRRDERGRIRLGDSFTEFRLGT